MTLREDYEAIVEEKLRDGDFFKTMVDVKSKMNEGFYPQEFLDAIVQKHRKGYDYFDAYAYAQIHAWRCTEKLAMMGIFVGSTPYGDKETERNNKALNVHEIFDFHFLGGYGDNDGSLFIKEPIEVEVYNASNELHTNIPMPHQTLPLQVGYIQAHTTLLTLKSEWCLARWAYGHEWVYVFYAPNGGE